MNKSIHDIDLQVFQAPGPNRFSIENPAHVLYDRYSASRVSPTALYATYFNAIPNIIYPRLICCEKAQEWLIDNFNQDINDVYFTKCSVKQRSKLKYHNLYYFLYNDVLIYFDTESHEALLLFRHTSMETIMRIVTGLQKFKRRVRTRPEILLVVNSPGGF